MFGWNVGLFPPNHWMYRNMCLIAHSWLDWGMWMNWSHWWNSNCISGCELELRYMSIPIPDAQLHRSLWWYPLALVPSGVNLVGDTWVLQSDIPNVSKILLISPFWVKTNISNSLSDLMLTSKKEKTLSSSPSLQVKLYPFSSSYLITFWISFISGPKNKQSSA